MKALIELRRATEELAIALISCEGKITHEEELKDEIGNKLSNIIALLEVFTDANYTEEEQGVMFERAGQQIRILDLTKTVEQVSQQLSCGNNTHIFPGNCRQGTPCQCGDTRFK